jgi:hypothetical protein
MNQEPRWVRLVEKSRGQKSRATVPLNVICGRIKMNKKIKKRVCQWPTEATPSSDYDHLLFFSIFVLSFTAFDSCSRDCQANF